MAMGKVGAISGAGAAPVLETSKGGFGKVLEGMKGHARPPGLPVASEGAPHRMSAERTEAVRGACKAEGVERAPGGTSVARADGVPPVHAAHSPHVVRALDRVGEAQKRLDHILELAESGRSFSPAELLALQAHVYRASQELDLAGKVIEKATGGVKQVLQTQV
ncbi:ATP-dependent helicase HrpB [Melittangium boletus]|uniref:Type III secretion apparatus protein, YscI/HrpB family n=1 Tax=Melittangium boletus DSM 14713 TaxID=1294270 RepID=A0A250I9H4_9BACT|nr:ATP-dependent helicase HrpB [Melittangium boletus]ATB27863.1 type III secretion apparatus protein, YscI/HrpB family [Melittangium boletus DSM 14713]